MDRTYTVKMTATETCGNTLKFSAEGGYLLTIWREPREKWSFELSQGERVIECSVDSFTEHALSSVLSTHGLAVDFPERYP